MEKVVVIPKVIIIPIDERVRLMATSVKIINDFKTRGFRSRLAFVTIVQDYLHEFKDYHKCKILETFWVARLQDDSLNNKLEYVLKELKNE